MNVITFFVTPGRKTKNRSEPAPSKRVLLSTIAIATVVLSTLVCPKQVIAEIMRAQATDTKIADLSKQLEAVKELLKEKENSLATLSGKDWAVGHVGRTLARAQAAEAQKKIDGGKFKEAMIAVRSCQKALNANSSQAELPQAGPVLAGLILGHPYLGNDKVVYLWAKPKDGAGLVSIFDRENSRELLAINPAEATFWEITVKRNKSGGASVIHCWYSKLPSVG